MSDLYTIDKLKKHFEVTAEELLPSQSGNSGKFLTTDGSDIEWASVDALPSQSGNSGKYLTTNGETASWTTVDALPDQAGNSGKYLTTDGSSASWEDIDEYTLPTASSSTLGGVKVGTNLSIDSSTGVLSATDTVTTVTVTGEGNAITNITDSNGALTATRGSTFSLSNHTHDNVYAPLDSPTFTGTPTAPTATVGTNDTQIATTAFVNTAVSSLVGSAPETLDTLNELAAALGNDPNFATTIASDIGSKLDSNSANYVKGLSISGTTITVTAGDNSTSTLTTQDTTYTLPEATTSTLGGVIVGDGLSVSNGTISVDDQLPTQAGNSGKFLTTDGTNASWSDILNEIKISSVHYPTANATTVVLTQAQAIPSTTNKYTMSVYRNGIYLNPSIDYGYNNSTRTLTFTDAFEDDEIVTVVFSYLDTDSQVTLDIDVDEYEAGTGVTFTNNAVTNKVVINADDQLPSQTNNSGKFLTTDGSTVSWETVDALPDQTDNSGKFLTTNGTSASWDTITPYTLPEATTSTLGGVIVGSGLSVNNGTISVNDQLPSQTSNSGKFLTTNGTSASWATVDALPSQTGNSGKFLTTDGTDASWGSPFSLVREFNTTAGQNTLTLPSDFLTLNQYDAMVVFLDGIRLVKNVDYTFDSSTRVLTFVDTFISGDTVTVGLYANNYEALSSGEFPALASGILTSDGNSMSWKSFTKMVYTHDTTSANETVTIPQANLTDAVVTDVFRNGLLLVESDDYTIDSSTREITFVVPLAANEKIVVVTQNAIINSANLISGATLQNSTANTPSAGDNSTSIATTAFVNNAISGIDLSNYATTSAVTTAINNRFANPIEKVNVITSAASITIDPNAGSLFTLSLSTNASITIGNISNGPYTTNGSTITLYLSNTSNTITWDSKVTWMSGEAPDVTSNPSIITFVTFNGGTNWYGSSIEVTSSS